MASTLETVEYRGYLRGRRVLAAVVRSLVDRADKALEDENQDRQLLLEHLIRDLRRVSS